MASESPPTWPAAAPTALDLATEATVTDLLSHMTQEDKVAQMIQADIASITPAELAQYRLGSILAGGNAAPNGDPRATPEAWLKLTDAFYRASLTPSAGAHAPIPILFGIDAVHGNAKLVGATIFPHNVGLGAAHDTELVRDIGAATAAEVAAIGIDWTFAPTVAVARDVRWGRSYESYSESPDLVSQYAAMVVEGIQGKRGTSEFLEPPHTLASVKHFIGDGGTRDGRDQGDTQMREAQLRDIHGAGYLPALNAGAMIVMASYNSWNGQKTHGNHHLLTDVLKGQLGFQGFVVGDWNGHEQIPGCTKFDCAPAVLAGVDMLMAPDSWKLLYEHTLAEARSQMIPATRIDDAVRRILRVKVLAGLLTREPPTQRSGAGRFELLRAPAHRALARRAVRESLVLLKNDGGALPLHAGAHILVCGDLADNIGAQSGGWTIDWQGDRNRNQDFPGATSLFAGIRDAAAASGGTALLSATGEYRERPDVAVVVFGESPYAEFQGDRETLEFSPGNKQTLALLQKLKHASIPTISVFLSGRPLWVNPEINASNAFVAAWLPGSEGEGVADVLFGRVDGQPVDFTGRLAFSWPATAMPVHYRVGGQVDGALYERGFGLTYKDRTGASLLSENPRVATRNQAPAGSLFHAGHPTAPSLIFVADGGEQVHLSTARQESPRGAVSAEILEEGVRIEWFGSTEGQFEIAGPPRDLTASAQTLELRLRYRVFKHPDAPVRLRIACSRPRCGANSEIEHDITARLRQARIAQWQTLSVPVSCLSPSGADFSSVEMPFVLATSGHLALTLGDVVLTDAGANAPKRCPDSF